MFDYSILFLTVPRCSGNKIDWFMTIFFSSLGSFFAVVGSSGFKLDSCGCSRYHCQLYHAELGPFRAVTNLVTTLRDSFGVVRTVPGRSGSIMTRFPLSGSVFRSPPAFSVCSMQSQQKSGFRFSCFVANPGSIFLLRVVPGSQKNFLGYSDISI